MAVIKKQIHKGLHEECLRILKKSCEEIFQPLSASPRNFNKVL